MGDSICSNGDYLVFTCESFVPSLTRAGLGSLDRWLGVIFGLRGYLLVLLAFIGLVLTLEGENKLPTTIQRAESTPLFSLSAKYLVRFMPDDYGNKLSSILIDHKGGNVTATEAVDYMIDNDADILKKPLELLNDEMAN